MSYVEIFSRESSEGSVLACDNDAMFFGGKSYGVALDDTTPATLVVFPGIYRAWLKGRDPAVSVYLSVGEGDVVEPDTNGKSCIAFSGDVTVRLRIPHAGHDSETGKYGQTVSAMLSSGASSTTLYLVPSLPWLDEQGG